MGRQDVFPVAVFGILLVAALAGIVAINMTIGPLRLPMENIAGKAVLQPPNPAIYAPADDPFTEEEMAYITVLANTTHLNVTVQTEDEVVEQYVYKEGYYINRSDATPWKKFTFPNAPLGTTNWIPGKASAMIPVASQANNQVSVIVFVCRKYYGNNDYVCGPRGTTKNYSMKNWTGTSAFVTPDPQTTYTCPMSTGTFCAPKNTSQLKPEQNRSIYEPKINEYINYPACPAQQECYKCANGFTNLNGECFQLPTSCNGCMISTCIANGTLNPANSCQWCINTTSTTGWTNKPAQCPAQSTVACGATITPTNGCSTCVGNGTKCATGQTCDTTTWTCKSACTVTSCTNTTNPCSTTGTSNCNTACTRTPATSCTTSAGQAGTCQSGACVCTPKTKAQACGTNNCGTAPDGCGNTISCGTCTSPQTCSVTTGAGTCQATCTNECTGTGPVCSGNWYKTCGNYDSDSCTEWSTVTACGTGQTCSNGQCITPPCNNGDVKCVPRTFPHMSSVEKCVNGDWTVVEECSAGCSGNACAPTCTPSRDCSYYYSRGICGTGLNNGCANTLSCTACPSGTCSATTGQGTCSAACSYNGDIDPATDNTLITCPNPSCSTKPYKITGTVDGQNNAPYSQMCCAAKTDCVTPGVCHTEGRILNMANDPLCINTDWKICKSGVTTVYTTTQGKSYQCDGVGTWMECTYSVYNGGAGPTPPKGADWTAVTTTSQGSVCCGTSSCSDGSKCIAQGIASTPHWICSVGQSQTQATWYLCNSNNIGKTFTSASGQKFCCNADATYAYGAKFTAC